MQLRQGTVLNKGKYKIEKFLGQGGFGITYLASMKIQAQGGLGSIETEIKVAIKEFFMKDLCNRNSDTSHVSVPSVGSKEMVERFRRKFIGEANKIAGLQHPNIIKVFDVFEENGTAYYAMEYIGGASLNEVVKERGTLPEAEALQYIRQIASALDYIHQKKINHLDVKPANVLLKGNKDAILIDFGLSKQYDEAGEQTSSTPVGVSAGYAPVEQGKPGGVGQFSAPTDIYSLGATLYRLVTGKTPPDASDVVNEGLPSLPGHISEPTANAIQKAMEPGRRNRPQSIREFLDLLGGNMDWEETRFKEEKRNPEVKGVKDFKDFKDVKDIKVEVDKKKWNFNRLIPVAAIILAVAVIVILLNKKEPVPVNPNEFGIAENMVYVQGGAFQMGSNEYDDEKPVHSVTLSDYYIGKYAVTQAQWKAVMGNNPSYFKGDNLPVENVSWNDIQEFIRKLNSQTGKQYRLPTEAEWEYAARGGNRSKGYTYSGGNAVGDVAWYGSNSNSKTHEVGLKLPNELGLYDMSGNVWEWCSDWYGSYDSGSQTNPKGPASGSCRVLRGGSWSNDAEYCRGARRICNAPDYRGITYGFRLALPQ